MSKQKEKVPVVYVEEFGWEMIVCLIALLEKIENYKGKLPPEIVVKATIARAAVRHWTENPVFCGYE